MLLYLCISLLPSSLPPCPQVCSLCLFLHCCPENKFISFIFSDSTYMCQYTVFIFLFLTYFSWGKPKLRKTQVYTPMVTAAPFRIAKTWKNLDVHLQMNGYSDFMVNLWQLPFKLSPATLSPPFPASYHPPHWGYPLWFRLDHPRYLLNCLFLAFSISDLTHHDFSLGHSVLLLFWSPSFLPR